VGAIILRDDGLQSRQLQYLEFEREAILVHLGS
jgi:hypothetical protein